MEQEFLTQHSLRANRKKRKLFTIALVFFLLVGGGLFFALKGSLDMSDPQDSKLVIMLGILAGILLLSVLYGLISSILPAKNGKNLTLPFKNESKAEATARINREIAEGKLSVDEPIDDAGERVYLTASYLLLDNGMGKITVIPRDKIYWLCAQVGIKGRSSYVVRLQIFTELKMFHMDAADIPHTEEVAQRLYEHIPNIFSEYDPFELSYKLEELYEKDRAGFLAFYEKEKNKE